MRQLNLNPISTGWRGGQDGQIITSIIRKPHVQRLRRLSPTSFNPSPTTCIQHFDSSNGKLLKACLVLFYCHRRLNSMTVPCFIFQVVQVVASGVLGHWWWLLGLARRTGHESAAMLNLWFRYAVMPCYASNSKTMIIHKFYHKYHPKETDKIDVLFDVSYIFVVFWIHFLYQVGQGLLRHVFRRSGPTVLSSQRVQQALMQRTSWTRTKLMRLLVLPTDMDDQLEYF